MSGAPAAAPLAPVAAVVTPAPVIPTSSVVRHIPTPRKTGNKSVDARQGFEYDATVATVNILMAFPKIARDIADFSRQCVIDLKKEQAHGENFDDISKIDSYDSDWKALYVAKKLQVTPLRLGKAKAKDPKVVNHIFKMMLNCTGATSVPDECADRAVMDITCDKRIAETGDRPALLRGPVPIINSDGLVDWGAGVYKSTLDEAGLVTHVTHRPTGDIAVVDKEFNIIAGTWELAKNFDDVAAEYFRTKLQKYKIQTMFAANKGPNAMKQMKGSDKHFGELAKSAHAEVAVANALRTVSAMDLTSFKSPQKDAKKEGTKRCREVLKLRSDEAEKKRRASL